MVEVLTFFFLVLFCFETAFISQYIAMDDLELLISLPPLPKHWDSKSLLPHPLYVVQGIEPTASCTVTKHSTLEPHYKHGCLKSLNGMVRRLGRSRVLPHPMTWVDIQNSRGRTDSTLWYPPYHVYAQKIKTKQKPTCLYNSRFCLWSIAIK